MSSDPDYVAVCQCEWTASTRGGGVDRHSVETVAETHGEHCGPVKLQRVDESPTEGALADVNGETVTTFGGEP